jgi:hypothetical protein
VSCSCQYFNKQINFLIGYLAKVYYPGASKNIRQFLQKRRRYGYIKFMVDKGLFYLSWITISIDKGRNPYIGIYQNEKVFFAR